MLAIDYIGYYSPVILLLVSTILLRNSCNYLKYFLYGYIGTNIFNIILKAIIQQPRPSNDVKILELAIKNGQRLSFDKYGMPSGHAQTCGFCLAFIALVFNDPYLTTLYGIISMITMYQRYQYNNHTIMQLIIGFIIGLLTGIFLYYLGNTSIKGKIKLKPDDNARV
jgi:membrane-associated phospholipid phosphatase